MNIHAKAASRASAVPERRSSLWSRARQTLRGASRRLSRESSVLLVLLSGSAFLASDGTVCRAQAQIHARREHKRDYKREIEAVEEQWRTAQIAGDIATMDKLMAEDYFGISPTGQLNDKMQQLERLKNRSFVLSKIAVSDVKIKLLGRAAIVTSLAQIEGTNEGAPLRGKFRYTRVYRRYPDGSWKITNFEVTRVPEAG